MPENQIKLTVKRIGGAYGAKITRSSLIACACALACHLSGLPVRFVMTIEAMMSICGHRYACANQYNVMCNSATGKIRQLNNFFVEDSGCTLNEVTIEVTLDAFPLQYDSSQWKCQGKPLITNTPNSTWCRGPGTTEAVAMAETIMEHIAHTLQIDPVRVRLANLPDRSLWKSLLENIIDDIGKKKTFKLTQKISFCLVFTQKKNRFISSSRLL